MNNKFLYDEKEQNLITSYTIHYIQHINIISNYQIYCVRMALGSQKPICFT